MKGTGTVMTSSAKKPKRAKAEFNVAAEVEHAVALARDITIPSRREYEAAAEVVRDIVAARKKIEAFFAPMKAKAYEAHRTITTEEKRVLAPLLEVEKKVRETMTVFLAKEAAELREIRAAEAAAAKQQQDAVVASLRAAGLDEMADEYAQTAPALPTTGALAPKTEGTSERSYRRFEVYDPAQVPRELCSPDPAKIEAALRGAPPSTRIPGVRWWEELRPVVRS